MTPMPSHDWRLRRLLLAPHRLAFACAALLLALSGLWWAGVHVAAAEAASAPPGLAASGARTILHRSVCTMIAISHSSAATRRAGN